MKEESGCIYHNPRHWDFEKGGVVNAPKQRNIAEDISIITSILTIGD